ncbi:hypothetical protein ABPG72_014472 [Tetrahymena utriculariae]
MSWSRTNCQIVFRCQEFLIPIKTVMGAKVYSNCEIIWFEVEGCDELIICGKRHYEMDFYVNVKQFMKFKFDWRKLYWVTKEYRVNKKERKIQKGQYQVNKMLISHRLKGGSSYK